MYKYYFLILFSLIYASKSFGQKYYYQENTGKDGLKITESKPDLITLSFAIEKFELQNILVENLEMTKIIWGNAFLPGKEGFPELPSITKNIVIPNDANIELSFNSKSNKTINNLIIHPAAKTPGELQAAFEAKRGNCYSENSFYPKSPIQISYTEIRGLRVARISVIPFQFNPVSNELIIHKNLDIELKINSKSNKYGEDRFRSIYWDQILADVIFNFEDLPPINYFTSKSADEEGCNLLIICPNKTEFLQWADTIKRFRNEQGISTRIFSTEQIGGNDTTIIKQFIVNAYESWNPVPSAILLLADHGYDNDGVLSRVYKDHPEFSGSYVGDNYYGDITNNDLPDIVIGRIPAKNDEELKIMINKYIGYESKPPTDYSFYKTPLVACGYQTNRWFQMCIESISGFMKQALGKEPVRVDDFIYYVPYNIETDPWSIAPNSELPINYFGVNGLNYIPEAPVDCGVWGGGTANDIIAQLEFGSFISIFRDHGGEDRYGCPEFKNNDIERLNNKRFPTFLFSFACYNGAFNYGNNCLMEAFLLHKKGGAFSGIAATTWSWSFYNDCVLWGTIDNLWPGFLPDNGNSIIPFREYRPAFGLAAGKYYMSNSNWIISDTNKKVTNRIWTYFGDPYGIVYTAVPMNNPISHLYSLNENSSSLEIEAEPLSLVCLSIDGEIMVSSFTNDVGKTILEFEPQTIDTKLKIVITKQNYFRYEEDIYVVPAIGPYLVLKEIIQRDDNNNGLVDYNETVKIDFRFRNYGHSSTEITNIQFSGDEKYYHFIGDLEYELGEIEPNSEMIVSNTLELMTDNEIPDQYSFNIEYDIENTPHITSSHISILANAPVFQFFPMAFVEINGNGDNYPDPGEILDIELKYINIGHSKFPSSTFNINTPSPYLSNSIANNQIPETNINDTISLHYQMEISQAADSHSLYQCKYSWNTEFLSIYSEQFFFTGKVIEDFEQGNLEKFDWYFEGDKDWEIVSDYVEDGVFSLKIDGLVDNEEASVNLDYYFGADYNITFSSQVSSEKDKDILSFLVNDSLIYSWSSLLLFASPTELKYIIPKGHNKLTWKYTKNESISSGLDAAWLDRIILPPIDSLPGIGLHEMNNRRLIEISPNPTDGKISIFNNHSIAIKQIELIGIDGQLLQQINVNIIPKTKVTFNLSSLQRACYIIKLISSNDEIFINKLIIK